MKVGRRWEEGGKKVEGGRRKLKVGRRWEEGGEEGGRWNPAND